MMGQIHCNALRSYSLNGISVLFARWPGGCPAPTHQTMKATKPCPTPSFLAAALAVLAVLLAQFAAPSAFAATYYYDNNSSTAGFGTGGGTWAAPTPGPTPGWSTSATGVLVPGSITTGTADTLNFGTATDGLVAGTITVSGTVNSGNMTFGSASGTITFSGGTINLAASPTLTLSGTKTMGSTLSGAGTSLAITGSGTLNFTAGAAGFGAGATCTVGGGSVVRFSSGGGNGLGGSTGYAINLGDASGTSTAILEIGNSLNIVNNITVVSGSSGTKTLRNNGNPSASFSGNVTANDNLTVSWSGASGGLNVSGTGSTIASTKTVSFSATGTGGTLTDSAIWGGSGKIAYSGNNGSTISVQGAKTYNGGATLNAMSGAGAVAVVTSSVGSPGALTSGPFGTSTLTIGAATKLRASTGADVTLGNAITFSANPTFPTIATEKSLIFTGDAALGATRTLTCEVGSTVADKFVEFKGVISGATFGITKAGAGTLRLSTNNTYSGDTTVNVGKLQGVTGGSSASSTLILNVATATNAVVITDNTLGWTNAAFTASAAGALEFDFGAVTPSASVSPFRVTGAATFTATPTVRIVVASGLVGGTYPLMTWGSTSGTAPTAVSVSTLLSGTAASLSVSGNTLNLVIGESVIVKANNQDNLNLTTSWVGGVVPTSADWAKWDSTVAAANTTVLGADTTWANIRITNPGGLVTINPGSPVRTLTLNGTVDMIGATADLTLNCPLTLGGASTWNVTSGRTLTVGGAASGAFSVTKQGAGTAVISGANAYTGDTTISTGTLKLGAADVIPHGTGNGNVTVTGTLDLNTYSESINALSGAGTVDTVAGGTPTLTVSNDLTSTTFSGVIQNTAGTLGLTKTGTNLFTVSGGNTYSGLTTVSGGTLRASTTNALGGTAAGTVVSSGATLSYQTTLTVSGEPLTLSGTGYTNGALHVGGNGTLTWNGPVTLAANSKIHADAASTINLTTNAPVDLGANELNVDIGNGLNSSFAGNISGIGGSITKTLGTTVVLTLSGSNTYTGPTTISAGLLTIQSDTALGTSAAGTTVASGAVLQLSGAITVTNETLTLNGTGISSAGALRSLSGNNVWTGDITAVPASALNRVAADANQLTLSGNIAMTGISTDQFVLQGNGDIVLSGIISGAGRVSSSTTGTGTRTLSGANTYTNATLINGGTVSVSSLNSVNGGTPLFASSSLGAPFTIADGTIQIGNPGRLLYTGPGETTDRVINLNVATGVVTIDQSGAGLLKFTSNFTATVNGAKTLTLQGSTAGSGEVGGAIVNSSSATAVTKVGTGTWTLSGVNTYTGATTVSNGTLLVNGSLASGSVVTVVSGATLGGTGTISGTLTVAAGGIVAPGASIGALIVGGTPSLGGTVLMEIDRNGGSPVADNINFTSATFGGALTLTNVGATLLNGDTFNLFDGSLSGTFATVNLPGGPAHWNTSDLNVGGTLTFTNASPVAQNITAGVVHGGTVVLPVIGGKNSATDADGDSISVTAASTPGSGSASFGASNVTYVASGGTGTNTFTYTVTDALGAADTKTVTVIVTNPQGFNQVSAGVDGGNAVLQYLGIPGTNYALEITHDLPATNWVPVITNPASANGYLYFTNPISLSPTNDYYRTRYAP